MNKRIAVLFLSVALPFLAVAGAATLNVAAKEVGDAPAAGAGEAALPVASPLTSTATYTVTDLGTLGGDITIASGVNELGQVAGQGINEDGNSRAFIWLPGPAYGLPAGMSDLGTLGGAKSAAGRINDAGQIVGGADSAAGEWRAFLWENGAMQDLGPGGFGGTCSAGDINNNGQVTGCTPFVVEDESNVYTPTHAFLWQNGSMSSLGTLGEEKLYSWGSGINDAGQVVGSSQIDESNVHAFLWDGAMMDLGTLAGNVWGKESHAHDVNEAGEVVGMSHVAENSNDIHAVLWLPSPAYGLSAGINDLGTLGGSLSFAQAINNNGQVVGLTIDGDNQPQAFIWENGEMVNLNEQLLDGSGWNLERATDINDAGQIVGYGTLDGEQRAFLLTPAETPWTLMFYLDGDNNLSHTYPRIFNQLERAADNPAVNVVVLWDGPSAGDSAYYHVQHDTDLSELADYTEGETMWSQGEVNMGFPTTLSDFGTWAMEEFPARHYALILDDHGSGLGGGLVDDTSGRTMNLPEMQLALATIHEQTGEKMDVLFMAMCLMGMIEDAYQFRDYADYYVANENIQWAYSAPYEQYVAGITETSTPVDVAQQFADAYADVAEAESDAYTISVVDMAQVQDVATAAYDLGGELDWHMSEISPTVTAVLTDVQRFDNRAPRGITLADTSIDLYHFADLVSLNLLEYGDIVIAATALMSAVDDAVIYERHASSGDTDLDESHGLAVFFPSTSSSFYHPDNYDFAVGASWGGGAALAPAEEGGWGAMLVEYVRQVNPEGPDESTPPEPVPKSLPLSELFIPVIRR